MKRIALAALLLLALSAGAGRAQESPVAHLGGSWSANVWVTLVDLVEAIFGANPGPPPPPPNTTTSDNDCGSYIDPTGGCRG